MTRTALLCCFALLLTLPAAGQIIVQGQIGPPPVQPVVPGRVMIQAITPASGETSTADLDEVDLNWTVTDGDGKQWDLNAHGAVSDGTNDAYDGGMMLQVNGNTFQDTDNKAHKLPGREEIVLGPWNYQDKLEVYRQIYVDGQRGYCRWIDLFTNPTDKEITVKVQYQTNHGGSADAVTQADPKKPDNRGMVVAESNPSNNRPAVLHLWGMSGYEQALTPRRDGDNLYLWMHLKIPAGETVGLCLFNAQRDSSSQARELLNTFNIPAAIADLDPTVREVLINVGGSFVALPGKVLNRPTGLDRIALADGTRLDGTITNKTFSLRTSFGKVLLPAGHVLAGQSIRNGQAVRLALHDGQIVDGTCEEPLDITLPDGTSRSLPWWKIASISYRLGPPRPDEVTPARPMVVLRDGQRWAPNPLPAAWTLQSNLGKLTLPSQQIAAIRLATEPGQLQQVTLRNGSRISGLLSRRTLPAQLGQADEVPLDLLSEIRLAEVDRSAPSAPSALTLLGGDVIRGQIELQALPCIIDGAKQTITMTEIKSLRRIDTTARFILTDISGRTRTVILHTDTLPLSVGPDLTFPLPVGRLQSITLPAPKKPADPEPASTPAEPTSAPATQAVG